MVHVENKHATYNRLYRKVAPQTNSRKIGYNATMYYQHKFLHTD